MELPTRLVRAADRHVVSRALSMPPSVGRVFARALAMADPAPKGVRVSTEYVNGLPGRLAVPVGASEEPKLILFHGGAFAVGSPADHATFGAHIAKELGASVILPAYRRTPEFPYPAAFDDVLAAWRTLARADSPMILAGDSAGGNLALTVAIALRDSGEKLPAGVMLFSPWADLSLSGDSVGTNEGKDALLRGKPLRRHASAYAGQIDPSDPRVSPLNAELAGLPPTLIQCGGDELFLSENTDLAARLQAAGVSADLQVYDGMWHAFQLHAGQLPDAARAIKAAVAWAKPLIAQ